LLALCQLYELLSQ